MRVKESHLKRKSEQKKESIRTAEYTQQINNHKKRTSLICCFCHCSCFLSTLTHITFFYSVRLCWMRFAPCPIVCFFSRYFQREKDFIFVSHRNREHIYVFDARQVHRWLFCLSSAEQFDERKSKLNATIAVVLELSTGRNINATLQTNNRDHIVALRNTLESSSKAST